MRIRRKRRKRSTWPDRTLKERERRYAERIAGSDAVFAGDICRYGRVRAEARQRARQRKPYYTALRRCLVALLQKRKPKPRRPSRRRRRWHRDLYIPGCTPRAARKMLNNAVARGVVYKPRTCESCGSEPPSLRLHGHHEDYEYPLKVDWLCADKCHRHIGGHRSC